MWIFGSGLFYVLITLSVSGPSGLNITAEPGQNITLPCRSPNIIKITVLEWNRADLLGDKWVFLFRSNRVDVGAQHESFRNRVFLLDPQMKDGDLSVVLNNVKIEDSGTYECKVRQENDPPGTDLKLISSIHLQVSPPPPPPPPGEDGAGDTDGGSHGHRVVVMTVPLVLLVVLAVSLCFIVKKKWSNQSSTNQKNPEEDHLNADCTTEKNIANPEPAV